MTYVFVVTIAVNAIMTISISLLTRASLCSQVIVHGTIRDNVSSDYDTDSYYNCDYTSRKDWKSIQRKLVTTYETKRRR